MIDQYRKIVESYQVLEVRVGAPFEEVKKTYIEKIKQCHPDVAQGDPAKAEDQAKRINAAIHKIKSLSPAEIAATQKYVSLSSVRQQAKKHAAARRAQQRARQRQRAQQWQRAQRRRPQKPRRPTSRQRPRRAARRQITRRGRDVVSQIEISRSQAANGSLWYFQIATCRQCSGWGAAMDAELKVCSHCHGLGLDHKDGGFDPEALCHACQGDGCTYSKRCRACGGTGEKTRYTVRCYIPSMQGAEFIGVLRGQGHKGFGGGEAGDLYLRVSVKS